MLGRRDQEEHAVVLLGFAELPKTKQLIGVSLDVASLQRFDGGDDELNAGFILEVFELCLNIAPAFSRHDAGLIDHPAAQRGKVEGKRKRRHAEEEGQRQRRGPRQAVIAGSKAQKRSGLHVRMSALPRRKAQVPQNFTCGGFSEPSLAVNSAIGLLPEKAVFAQRTVGNVRSAVL